MTEREKLAATLFANKDREVVNIKFLRGKSPSLTGDDMCAAARHALESFWSASRPTKAPANGRAQREVLDILASY